MLHRWLTGSTGPEEIYLHFLAAVVALHRCIASVGISSTGPEATALPCLTSSLKDSMVLAPMPSFPYRRCNRCCFDFFTWLGIAWPIAPVIGRRCIRSLPVRPVLSRRFNRSYCFLHPFVQLVAAVIWTPHKYSISAFSLWFDVSAVDWTHLYGELDILDFIHGT